MFSLSNKSCYLHHNNIGHLTPNWLKSLPTHTTAFKESTMFVNTDKRKWFAQHLSTLQRAVTVTGHDKHIFH